MFLAKKKKYLFSVDLFLDELSSVPFINGLLFAKIRLLDERSSANFTSKSEEVKNHCVKWGKRFTFTCKMSANVSNGVLDSKLLRLSIRKEAKGGRSFQKLGFRDIDLAGFAGSGPSTGRFLLEGYDTKHRQDNSTLQVTIDMNLVTGDPLFKRPSLDTQVNKSIFYDGQDRTLPRSVPSNVIESQQPRDHPNGIPFINDPTGFNKGSSPDIFIESSEKEDKNEVRRNGSSPSFVTNVGTSTLSGHKEQSSRTLPMPPLASAPSLNSGHTRNLSTNSQQSKVSAGYGSLPSHSRQGSADSSHMRMLSSGSSMNDSLKFNSTERKQRVQNTVMGLCGDGEKLDNSRPNPEQVINDLVSNIAEGDERRNMGDDDGEMGLQLILESDGTATLGSRNAKTHPEAVKGQKKKRAVVVRTASKDSNGTNNNSRQSSIEQNGELNLRL